MEFEVCAEVLSETGGRCRGKEARRREDPGLRPRFREERSGPQPDLFANSDRDRGSRPDAISSKQRDRRRVAGFGRRVHKGLRCPALPANRCRASAGLRARPRNILRGFDPGPGLPYASQGCPLRRSPVGKPRKMCVRGRCADSLSAMARACHDTQKIEMRRCWPRCHSV